MKYSAVVCPHCGRASGVKSEAKTHQCPYCGRLFQTEKAIVLATGSPKAIRQQVVDYNKKLYT